MGSFVSLAYESLGASRTLLKQLLSFLRLTLDSEDLFCWYNQRMISMHYGSNRRSWKPWRWVRLNPLLTMRDIYINSHQKPLTNLIASSSRSTEFKDILPWNISQMITKTVLIQHKNSISCAVKWGILL